MANNINETVLRRSANQTLAKSADLLSKFSTETNQTHGDTGSSYYGHLQKISVPSTVSMIVTSVGLLTNGTLMLVFIRNRHLRTPFNVYVINLIMANLLSVVLVFPLSIVEMLYPVWILGDGACIFRQYGKCIIQAASFNGHQLIAINRMWSVIHPYSYRLAHLSNRGPIIVCLCMWALLHLTVLPWLLIGMPLRTLPTHGRRCFFPPLGKYTYDIVIELGVFVMPIITMWSAFPIIFIAQRIRHHRLTKPTLSDSKPGGTKNGPSIPSAATEELIVPTSGATAEEREVGQKSVEVATIKMPVRIESHPVPAKRSRDNFVALALLTGSVCICWAPSNFSYSIGMFVKINEPVVFQVVGVLYSLQPTADPILFVIALRNVREAMFRMFRRSRRNSSMKHH